MRRVQIGLVPTLKHALSSTFQPRQSLRNLSTNALREADEKDEKPPNTSQGRGNSDFLDRIERMGKALKDESSEDPSKAPKTGIDSIFDALQSSSQGKLTNASMAFNGFGENISKPNSVSVTQGRRVPQQVTEITTAEALKKADFRNTQFLAKFMTEGGIIVKRRETGISAKAQRKIAREIKTARSFGLLPFTTQGTKSYVFGQSMQDQPDEYEFDNFGGGYFTNEIPTVVDNVVDD